VQKYVSISGVAQRTIQIGDGKAADEVKALYSGFTNPLKALEEIAKYTTLSTATISCTLNLKELSGNILQDMDLGADLEINAVATTQKIGELQPGIYFYADAKVDIMGAVVVWMTENFGLILNKLVGNGISERMVAAVKKVNFGSAAEFGIYVNIESFGFLIEFPAAVAASILAGPMGAALVAASGLGNAAGSLKVNCAFNPKSDTMHGAPGAHCGFHYGKPRWVAAVWMETKKIAAGVAKGTKWVAGKVEKSLGAAKHTLKSELNKVEKEIVHGITNAAVATAAGTKKAAIAVAGGTTKAANAVAGGTKKAANAVAGGTKEAANSVAHLFSGHGRRRRFKLRI